MSDRSVLFLDDEPSILHAVKRLLRQEEYELYMAENVQNALSVLSNHPVQVIVADYKMPEMTGIEFLQKVKELYPDTVRVILSGYAEAAMVVESINAGEVYRFLPKPWNDEELITTIRQCFQHYEVMQENRKLVGQLREYNEKLEVMVEERTKSLKLSQEVLERLPVGVLGIGPEGIVTLVNRAAKRDIPALQGILPGSELADLLSEEIYALISDAMKQKDENSVSISFEWEGILVDGRLASIDDEGIERGWILLVEPAN